MPRTARWLSADIIVPDPANPQSLNRYAYVLGNPLRYIDPTGYMHLVGGSARLSDENRTKMLRDFANQLIGIDDLTSMDRFAIFMAYASSLYSGEETDQFMVDVTAVLHGHAYKTEEGYMYATKHGDIGGGYFIGSGALYVGDPDVGAGWADRYVDGQDNQVRHFWFYVATAYFDGPHVAAVGNNLHDGWAVVGPLTRGFM